MLKMLLIFSSNSIIQLLDIWRNIFAEVATAQPIFISYCNSDEKSSKYIPHSVEIMEIYSHAFLAKISWKPRIY